MASSTIVAQQITDLEQRREELVGWIAFDLDIVNALNATIVSHNGCCQEIMERTRNIQISSMGILEYGSLMFILRDYRESIAALESEIAEKLKDVLVANAQLTKIQKQLDDLAMTRA